MVDYLLVVGPGRSGSDFLYRILSAHPDYDFPEIKEGAYYRSARAYRRGRNKVRQPARLLCDISNEAYRDRQLLPGIKDLQAAGVSILVVVLLRDHRDRAVSMMRYRKSRGEPAALLGARHLESATVRDRLTGETLTALFALNVDILTIGFPALVGDTARVLQALAKLCGTVDFAAVNPEPVNESVHARFMWLSSIGWVSGVVLRKLGLTRTLQRIKDQPLVQRFFFDPLASTGDNIHLAAGSTETLGKANHECWAIVRANSAAIGRGIYYRRARDAD